MRQSEALVLTLVALFGTVAIAQDQENPSSGETRCIGQTAEDVETAKAKPWNPIDVRSFHDCIHHAVAKFKGQTPPYGQYKPEQIIHIAENLLAYQNADGGWPENIDWLKPLKQEELLALPHAQPGKSVGQSTLDNSNIWPQVGYLAEVYGQTKMERYACSALKGIEYLLREQRASGGWRGWDVDAITFNDQVMAGVLRTLKAVADNRQRYSFVDDTMRSAAKTQYDKGIRCVLDCQIKVNGRLTAWCQQHDHKDLKPIWARTFEPPSITADESVGVLRVLMAIDHPSPEVIRSVQAGIAWLDKVKIPGLRLEKVPAQPVTFDYHYSDFDYIEVQDPAAPCIWARYYDLEEEKPTFCNRDYKLTRHFSEIARERRTGYPWYGYWPATLLVKEYPRWQKKWASGENVLQGK